MAFRIGRVMFSWKVFCATGARGFFGESYWYSSLFRLLGAAWENTNFAAKTTTFSARNEGMALAQDGISPANLFPPCIVPHWLSGHVLNAVGLSGPGAKYLLEKGEWQRITEPFSLSFMAVGETVEERAEEYERFVELFIRHHHIFKAPVVMQINFGCPNAGVSLEELRAETFGALRILSKLEVPLVPNFNPLVPAQLLKELEETGLCAGFWVANTIPYDHDGLGQSIFGQEVSPLIKRGFPSPGGISGPRCLKYTLKAVREARESGVTLPIIAGNGIQTPEDVRLVKDAGADAIALGIIAMLPFRMIKMRKVIETANWILGD